MGGESGVNRGGTMPMSIHRHLERFVRGQTNRDLGERAIVAGLTLFWTARVGYFPWWFRGALAVVLGGAILVSLGILAGRLLRPNN